jgi:hypothetical protein
MMKLKQTEAEAQAVTAEAAAKRSLNAEIEATTRCSRKDETVLLPTPRLHLCRPLSHKYSCNCCSQHVADVAVLLWLTV